MIVHAYYEEDSRVRREAESLVARGWPVEVFALRRPEDPAEGTVEGVRVHRLNVQRHQGAGLMTYLREYLAFLARSAWAVTRAHRRRRFGLVEVHTLPDFLVFAGLPLRLMGVPLVLDLHEAMPEFFRARFPGRLAGPGYRLLLLQERLACAVADAVITVNEMLGERLVAQGVRSDRIHVIRNSPALARFDPAAYPARAFMADGTLRLVYAGALSPIYELDVVIEAIARLATSRPALPIVLECYGRDFGEVPLADQAAALGVSDRVRLHGRVPLEDVPRAIAGTDIGIGSTRRSAMTAFSLSTKLFEYAAMGKPVIASRLPMVERTFPPDEIATYEPGDAADLAAAIVRLVDDPAERAARVRRTLVRVASTAWEHEGARYVALIEALAARGR